MAQVRDASPKRSGDDSEDEPLARRRQRLLRSSGAVERYAITFGEVAILHVGGGQVGQRRETGFSCAELCQLASEVNATGGATELHQLDAVLPEELRQPEAEASVLVIRNAARYFGLDVNALLREQKGVQYDKKYWDQRRKKTLNKRARYNVVFGEQEVAASEDFQTFSVVSFKRAPLLNQLRQQLATRLGPRAADLNAEGNHYYEKRSGIGFHGDAERKTVICLSLGASSKLVYRWRKPRSSENVFAPIELTLDHGDLYIMSEKATGYDWTQRSKLRLVHAAGADSYIHPKPAVRRKKKSASSSSSSSSESSSSSSSSD